MLKPLRETAYCACSSFEDDCSIYIDCGSLFFLLNAILQLFTRKR